MSTIRILTPGLPDDSGRTKWDATEFVHVAGRSLPEYLDLPSEKMSHVVVAGHVLRGVEIDEHVVLPESEFHVIPLMEGKNAGLILGVVGFIIGGIVGGPAGAGFGWTAAMQGFAIGSMIGSLLVPKPHMAKDTDSNMSSYMWGGVQNETRAGVPIPIVYGEHRAGGVVISQFIRRDSMKERLHTLLLVSKGPIESITDVRINGQAYTNFPGVEVETRLGGTGQPQLHGFNSVANTYSQNQIVDDTPAVYTTVATDIDAFEILLTLPGGLMHTDGEGRMRSNTFTYKASYRVNGTVPWTSLADKAVVRSTRSQTFETVRVEGLAPGQYDIKVEKVSIQYSDPMRDVWEMYLTGITEEKQDQRTYDGYALLAVRALATDVLNGGPPMIDSIVRGLKVPTWTGVAMSPRVWSKNPAWFVLELMRNTDFGLGNEVPDAKIDMNRFKEWADYCDELVTVDPEVGLDYTEPRHQLDVVLNQQVVALDLLNDLAATSRAVIAMSGDKWRPVVEKADTPVQMFSDGSFAEDSFEIQYSRGPRINTYDVQHLDRDNDFQMESFPVSDHELVVVQGRPVKSETLGLPGITRRSEGFREARLRLNRNRVIRRVIQGMLWTDALLAEVGDVITIAHDLPQWGWPGRVVAGSTTTTVKLNRDVTIQPAKTYELAVRYQDGSDDPGDVVTVTNAPGTTRTLTVSPALAKAPSAGDLFSFGQTSISRKPYRIVSISRDGDSYRKIVAVEYNASLHDDSGQVTVVNYSDLFNLGGLPPAIGALVATEEIIAQLDGSKISNIVLQWLRPPNAAGYGLYGGAKVERSWNGTNWEDVASVDDGTEYVIRNAPHGVQMWFRVIPYSTQRKYNVTGAASTSITLAGYSTAPAAVQNLTVASRDNQFVFAWDDAGPEIQYEIRYADANWGTDVDLVWRGRATSWAVVPTARSRQIFIKAFDAFGNYATGAVTNGTGAIDTAPSAPTLGTPAVALDTLSVQITPPADTDVVALHLHVGTTVGFTPSDANRVATISGKGGTVTFTPSTSAVYYMKAAAEDWLSASLGDWVYSAEASAQVLVIATDTPSAVSLNLPDEGRFALIDSGGVATRIPLRAAGVTWTHPGDDTNPPGSLIGFQIALYDATADPTIADPLYDSGFLADPAKRGHRFLNTEMPEAVMLTAAVKAIYVDGFVSAWGTSLGTSIGGPGDPLVVDSSGRIEIPESCVDFFPLAVDPVGVLGTGPIADRTTSQTTATKYYRGLKGLELFNAAAANEIDQFDLSAWSVKQNCTVALNTEERLPINPPEIASATQGAVALNVYKLTVTAGATLTQLYSAHSTGGTIASQVLNHGAWIKNRSNTTRQVQAFLWAQTGGGQTGGHRTIDLPPGAWVRVATSPGTVWSALSTGNDITTVFRFGKVIGVTECDAGDSFSICLPQLQRGSAGDWLRPFNLTTDNVARGSIHLPVMSLNSTTWTVFLRFRYFADFLAAAPASTISRLISLAGIDATVVRSVIQFIEMGLGVGETRQFRIGYYDQSAGTNVTSTVTHGYADDEERVIALRRDGGTFSIFAQDSKIHTWATGVDPLAEAVVVADRAILGSINETDSFCVNGPVRNLAVMNEAMSDAEIIKVLKLGVNFVANPGRVVVPAPLTVELIEV